MRLMGNTLRNAKDRRESTAWGLHEYWGCGPNCRPELNNHSMPKSDFAWLVRALEYCPSVQIEQFMDMAKMREIDRDLRYVKVCVRNWREQRLGVGGDRGADS